MKSVPRNLIPVVMLALLFFGTSCFKNEGSYPLPEIDTTVQSGSVSMGEDYSTQIFFSLKNGQVLANEYKSWDISFTTRADSNELWMNGGKNVLIYPTGTTDFAAVTTTTGISSTDWKYDAPGGLITTSGLGILGDSNHIGEVLIADDGAGNYYKLQIEENTATAYTIKTAALTANTGTEITLPKDTNYNYVFYSFANGIVAVEPPKTDWDLLFTRYRHVYVGFNNDGSDMLYIVNGVLANPYNTQTASDTSSGISFEAYSLDNALLDTLKPNRDEIGFDWKSVNINTATYTVLSNYIYLVSDQESSLWKLHFTNFYDDEGHKGTPKFEYQRLK
ncbi:MAG: HmuY family protein [Edaphocola sp.]